MSDELYLSRKISTQTVKLTAGLHRQTWISGYPVFVDVHIENWSSKDLKKAELQLEKATLFHDYSAPSAGTRPAEGLRVPNYMQREIISRTHILDEFQGVRALSQDFRTFQMQLPTGLVSIETGRYALPSRSFVHAGHLSRACSHSFYTSGSEAAPKVDFCWHVSRNPRSAHPQALFSFRVYQIPL